MVGRLVYSTTAKADVELGATYVELWRLLIGSSCCLMFLTAAEELDRECHTVFSSLSYSQPGSDCVCFCLLEIPLLWCGHKGCVRSSGDKAGGRG